MNSVSSDGKDSGTLLTPAVLHNARLNIKRTLPCSIIIGVLLAAAIPVFLIAQAISITNGTYYDTNSAFNAILTTVAAGLTSMITAFLNFRYLFNKTQADVYCSLPMSKKQKFASDYLSGLVSCLLPYAVVSVLSGIILLVLHITMDGKVFEYTAYEDASIQYTCTIFKDFAPFFMQITIAGIFCMVMLYSLTTLVISSFGNLALSAAVCVLVNVVIPGIFLLAGDMLGSAAYGLDITHVIFPLVSCTSPAGAFAELAFLISGSETDIYIMPFALWLLCYAAVTALYAFLAFRIYKSRKAEDTSRDITNKALWNATTIVFSIALAIFIAGVSGSMIAGTVLSFAAFSTADIIENKYKLKNFWRSLLKYFAGFVCSAAVISLIVLVGVTGSVKKIPDAQDVKCIYLSYGGLFTEYPFAPRTCFNEICKNSSAFVMLEERESIEAVTKLHEGIIDTYNASGESAAKSVLCYLENSMIHKYENIDASGNPPYIETSISITYIMNNGEKITRCYEKLPNDTLELVMKMESTNEFRTKAALNIADYVNSNDFIFTDANSDGFNFYPPRNQILKPFFFRRTAANSISNKVQSKFMSDFTAEEYNELAQALAKDISSVTAEEYFTPSEPVYTYIGLYDINCTVYPSYKNTIDFFERHSVEIEPCRKITQKEFDMATPSILLYTADEINAGLKYVYSDFETFYLRKTDNQITEFSDDLALLLEVASTRYISDKPCYTMFVNGEMYIIPYEYSDVAARVYETKVVS